MLCRWLDRALDLLAPRTCVACDEAITDATFCCACALEDGGGSPTVLDVLGVPALAARIYAGPVARGIKRLKYEHRADLAAGLAALVEPLAAGLDGSACVVPVPVHPRRLAERGFNQAALLAGRVAAGRGWPHSPLALRRSRWSERQVGRTREQRQDVAGAFEIRPGAKLGTRPIVLVDDVFTTGATLGACIAALRARAVPVLAVLTVARTVGPSDGI